MGEVPGLVPGEPRRLGVDAERLVEGDSHGLCRVAPAVGFRVADADTGGGGGFVAPFTTMPIEGEKKTWPTKSVATTDIL